MWIIYIHMNKQIYIPTCLILELSLALDNLNQIVKDLNGSTIGAFNDNFHIISKLRREVKNVGICKRWKHRYCRK